MKHVAYKFELRPSREQEKAFIVFSGQARFIYNRLLAMSKDAYAKGEKFSKSQFGLNRQISKVKSEFDWLREGCRDSHNLAADNLAFAYSRYFNWLKTKTGPRVGHPKYKSKRGVKSFGYKQRVRVDGNKVLLPKIGWVRFRKSREVVGEIKTASVTQSATGKWFVSIVCIRGFEPGPATESVVGVDVGLRTFATLSTGEKIESPRWLQRAQASLVRLQRKLSRAKRGSNNRAKVKVKLARKHEQVANQRRDFQHKLSTRLVNENQVIGVEDLSVKSMMCKLGRGFGDKGLSEFFRQVEYKCGWRGRVLVKADRYFPSTKTCNVCKSVNKVALGVENWVCSCGTTHDRDVNAAINLKQLAVGHTERLNASGELVSLALAS